MTPERCLSPICVDFGTPDDQGPSATYRCDLRQGHDEDHRNLGAGVTWKTGQSYIYRSVVSSLPMPKQTPLDLTWARRCAADFDAKPTEARARNAAQCLTGLLDAYDDMRQRLAFAGVIWPQPALALPPELCRATQDGPNGERLTCFLAAQHHGDHSTGGWPHHTTWPKEPATNGPPVCHHRVIGCPEPDRWHRHDGKSRCEDQSGCEYWTSLSCARCERDLCKMHAACNLETMIHNGGMPCQPIVCRYKGCETPREDPGHLHSAAPFGMVAQTPVGPTGDATEPRTAAPWRCAIPGCKTPDEVPWHLHSAPPFGMLTERRWRELNPEAPSAEI